MNEEYVKTIASAAALEVLTTMGLTSGEVSRARAIAVYGSWFRDAEAAGRLRPVRTGSGKTATKWYAVADILALKALDQKKAELQLKAVKTV